MSDKPGRPLFLERQGYRRRRLADAAFLLPVFGVLLFCAPVLWPLVDQAGSATGPAPGTPSPVSMSSAILYVFGAWLVLIVLTAFFGGQVRRRAMDGAMDGALDGAMDQSSPPDPVDPDRG